MFKQLDIIHLLCLVILTLFSFIALLRGAPILRKDRERQLDISEIYIDESAPSGRVVLISPPEESITTENKPTFVWERYFSFPFYTIQISKDHSFFDKTVEEDVDTPFYFPKKGFNTGIYFWRVRARDDYGNKSRWSLKSCFLVGPMEKAFPRAELVSPVYSRIGFKDYGGIPAVKFIWEPPMRNENCFIYPKKYEVQISSSAYFKRPFVDDLVSINRYKVASGDVFLEEIPRGAASAPFYWRVRSEDTWGNVSSWSVVGIFHLVNANISTL